MNEPIDFYLVVDMVLIWALAVISLFVPARFFNKNKHKRFYIFCTFCFIVMGLYNGVLCFFAWRYKTTGHAFSLFITSILAFLSGALLILLDSLCNRWKGRGKVNGDN